MKPSTILVALTGILCNVGCQSLLNSSVMEQRVVEQFADAVREENEPALRRITSTEFEQKALRSDDVLRDLRVLRLPTGELSVVEVTDLSPSRREVIVKEESGGKYQFQLVKDRKKNYWVVDDVIVRHRNKGTQITKSTTEVMDLLMTLRDFLSVWENGNRDEILAMTSPGLTASLQPLPDAWMQALTKRIASTYEDGMARKPEANLTENDAVVKLPSKNGHLMIRIVRNSGQWLVDDVESHNHRESNHPGSIRRQADAMNIVNGFLTAYAVEDDALLKNVTTEKFYNTSLELADLSIVQLPKPADVPAEFDIRAYENLLTFMLPAGREIVRLDLEEQTSEIPDIVKDELGAADDTGPRFLIREVTLYEKGTDRQRALSSVFTAPTRAALFLKALQERDHRILSQVSTSEFSTGTWQRATPGMLAQLPIPEFYDEGLKLTDSHSIGARTELEFRNGTGAVLSCQLLNQNGLLKIDDVQYPNNKGQVTSLKNRLELSIPLLEFSTAWVTNDMDQLQKACSSDFNRLVWSHLNGVPGRFSNTPLLLRTPIVDTRVTQDRATVRLGDGTGLPVTASLVIEHGYWVVDEVRVDEGNGTLVAIRETLRGQIAAKLSSGSYSTVHRDDGHQIVVPVRNPADPVDLTPTGDADNSSSVDAFARWADSGETSTPRYDGKIQQASAEATAEMNRGAVNHAIYHRELTDGQSNAGPDRVTPAVYSRELPTETPIAPNRVNRPDSGNLMLMGSPRSRKKPAASAATSTAGVQVFGPQAKEIADSIDGVPMPTTAVGAEAAVGDVARPMPQKENFVYFGPATEAMSRNSSDEPVGTAVPRIIRQPSDAPISID